MGKKKLTKKIEKAEQRVRKLSAKLDKKKEGLTALLAKRAASDAKPTQNGVSYVREGEGLPN